MPIVYPAHGAGSAWEKYERRRFDYWKSKNELRLTCEYDRSRFVKEVTDGLLPPPATLG
jgi:hypothetical protein